jgi:hypothetical protein
MSLRDQPAQHLRPEEDNEAIVIDWRKVLQFFLGYYRYLLVGTFGGMLLGLAVSFGFQSYEIRLFLPNVFKAEFSNYRELTLGWTSRARELVRQDLLSPVDKARFERFSSERWWNQHIIPVYSLSKTDLKDRVGVGDIKSTTIIGLQLGILTKGDVEGSNELLLLRQFIYSAYAYTQTRNLIKTYEQESLSSLAVLNKEMNLLEVSLADAKRRSIHLEELQKRYPSSTLIVNQMVDPKDEVAKFLPVTTQLVAAKNDLFVINERLTRLRERKTQAKFMEQFLSEAKPILLHEQDGLKLISHLLEIVSNLRKGVAPNDLYPSVVLNRIQVDFMNIQTPLRPSFNEPPTITIISNLSLSKSVALGFFGGSFLALLICLGLYFWPSFKRAIAKAQQMD